MKREQKKVLYEETGKSLIDIAKYTITGVLISSLLEDFENQRLAIYIISIIVAGTSFIAGLLFIKQKEE